MDNQKSLKIKRWPIDLYIDLSDTARRSVIEEYSCEKAPEDGEIYYKIRKYDGYFGAEGKSPYFLKRWWALLEITLQKRKNMERLLTKLEYCEYKDLFDIQMEIPGQAWGIVLGNLHTIFATSADVVKLPPRLSIIRLIKNSCS